MVSFIIILVSALLVAAAFVWVMAPFLLPMFLAVLLVVMFRPLQAYFLQKCKGHSRLAAGLTTTTIIVIVLAPLLVVLVKAAAEGYVLASTIDQEAIREASATKAGRLFDELRDSGAKYRINVPDNQELAKTISSTIEGWLAPAALRTTQFVWSALVGLAVMIVSLYFFLADGPAMVHTLMRLTPLDSRYEQQLVDEFDRVSRAVVLGTLSAAVGQGVLAGIAFFLCGMPSVFLLSVLTMLLSLVPVIGAAAVWAGAIAWLYWGQDRVVAAVLLGIWGFVASSIADYGIKPYVLHGQSNLHPLLALLSVLGGVETLGLIGIFVGPMVVAFLQALLNILRTELEAMDKRPLEPAKGWSDVAIKKAASENPPV
jgi:predicted PurR-regulated permease PerM